MQSVRVNVAVLSIADASARGNVAVENIVADRLTEAGHQIAAFEAVRDSETAIRSQLVGWIADPDVDVVVVIGESEATPSAMKPLVDQALPGFADLLRMLAYQEIGASAMLSAAEAARCGTTFVFVLPANVNAVKAAMEKLILPQLDPKTKPRNLIGSMPRLRDAVEHDLTKVDVAKIATAARADATDSVPTPIAVEKTASGAGPQPKLPAGVAPVVATGASANSGQRPRSRTGVNVIVRQVEDPTKPIDLEKLEQQLALSKEEEATAARQAAEAASINTRVTKPMIETPARPNIATRPLDIGNLRQPATPSANAKPLPSITAKAPVATEPSRLDDEADFGDVTKPLDLTMPATPTDAAAIATAKPRTATTARAKPSDVGDSTQPMDLGRLPRLPPGANTDALETDDTEQILTPPPKSRTASQPAVARIQLKSVAVPAAAANRVRQPTPPPPPAISLRARPAPPPALEILEPETLDLEPDAEVSGAATVTSGLAAASTATATSAPAAASTSSHASTSAPAAASTSSHASTSAPAAASAPHATSTSPAPAAAAASISAASAAAVEDPDPEVASSSFLTTPSPTRRKPTAPPPSMNDLITAVPGSSELPQGAFVYPTLRRSRVPLVIGLLVLSAVVGGGAMYLLNRNTDDDKQPAQVVQPTVAIDAAPVVAVVEVDAAEPEPQIEVESPDAAVEVPLVEPPALNTPATTGSSTTRPTTTTTPTTPKPGTTNKPATEKPATEKPKTEKPATGKPPTEKPVVAEKPAGPVAEPGCEEVTCVLEKYARPCCLRFKPAGETFQPSNSQDLSKPQIKAGVDKMKPRVIACGEQHQMKGTVKLSISVDPEGNVKELSVQTSPDDALGECVASTMRKAKFAKTANGGSFTYPFVF